jgi:uncharacterized lipoprotein YehR (DUF1307 family)
MNCTFLKYILGITLWFIVCVLIVGCDGLEEQKRFKNNIFVGDILCWIQLGAKDADLTAMQFTNKSGDRRFLYQTNIVVNGISYETVLRYDSVEFNGKGYLVATRNGSVIWVGSDGKSEITYPPKK